MLQKNPRKMKAIIAGKIQNYLKAFLRTSRFFFIVKR